EERPLDLVDVVGLGARRLERVEAHDDARRAEAALTRTARAERVGPPVRAREAVDGRDRAPRDPLDGRHTRDARCAVDQHRAATTLALRAAAVLRSFQT